MIRIDKYKEIDRGANPDKQYYIEQDGTRLSLTKVELEKIACDLNLLDIADVSGELPISCVNDFENPDYCSQRNNHLCQKCKDW